MNNYSNLGKILDIFTREQGEIEYILNDKYYRAYLLIREYINNHAQMRKEDFDFLNVQLDMLEDLIDSVKVNGPERRILIVRYAENADKRPTAISVDGDVLSMKILANHNQSDLTKE